MCGCGFGPSCRLLFFVTLRGPPISTLFPYTTLFRSVGLPFAMAIAVSERLPDCSCPLCSWIQSSSSLPRSEEHTSELQSRFELVCRLLLEKKNRDENEARAKAEKLWSSTQEGYIQLA